MRCPSSRSWLAVPLALGTLAGCYQDDFLLGAYCAHETDCGEAQCCAGKRCRPQGEDCRRAFGDETPFPPAYKACDSDEQCLVHGMPHCVFWSDADIGFCADYCIYSDVNLCEKHIDEFAPRLCIDVAGKSTCAIGCNSARLCPTAMECLADVCVPTSEP